MVQPDSASFGFAKGLFSVNVRRDAIEDDAWYQLLASTHTQALVHVQLHTRARTDVSIPTHTHACTPHTHDKDSETLKRRMPSRHYRVYGSSLSADATVAALPRASAIALPVRIHAPFCFSGQASWTQAHLLCLQTALQNHFPNMELLHQRAHKHLKL